MKKILCIILIFMLAFSACAELNIVCSLFPQYDFTRIIAGEHATVSQLLPWGMDSHEFEISPRAALKLADADMFIYTDSELEGWVSDISDVLTNTLVVRCADGIDLEYLNEIWETAEHESHTEHEEGHKHAYDAHIWLDPTLAMQMCNNIAAALKQLDPENADDYEKNLEEYLSELQTLDDDFTAVLKDGGTLYFGGKFAYSHFIRHYGIDYYSAYGSCSDEGEPGARTIIEMITRMNADGAKVIFTDEMSSGEVARSIAQETESEVMLFHTCHNLSAEDAAAGKTYLDIMRENLNNICIALGRSEVALDE